MTDQFSALAGADPDAAARVLARLQGRVMVPVTWQAEVERSRARFQVVRAGRRTGKTKLAARRIITKALQKDDSMNWWVANTYRNVVRGYREVLRQLPRELLAKEPPPASPNNVLILHLRTGATIEFYSAGKPDAMAGEGVDYLIGDEAALWEGSVWYQTIRPTLMDSKGGALLISTPRGQNWFWKLWHYGQGERKGYESWHFTPFDNPHIDPDEIEELRDSLPERLFKQEVCAEFLKGASALFNLEDALIVDNITVPEGQPVYMGVDLAKHEDFTVIRASREDGLPVWHDRFKDVSWPSQKEKITDAIDDLMALGAEGVTIGVDTGGPGDVIFDELDEEGHDVEAIKFGAPGQKYRMVKLLGADLERQRAVLLRRQVPEFEAFEYHYTDKGTMTFSAPEGEHDDEVAATMMEQWVRRHGSPGRVTVHDLQEEQEAETHQEIHPAKLEQIWARPDAWTRVA